MPDTKSIAALFAVPSHTMGPEPVFKTEEDREDYLLAMTEYAGFEPPVGSPAEKAQVRQAVARVLMAIERSTASVESDDKLEGQ